MIIYDIKDDPILQFSSQEPSTSSKSHLSFLSRIMLDLHQTFRISPISSTNMIYDVKNDPNTLSFQSGTSTSSKSHLLLSQPSHVGSSSNIQDISHIINQHDPWWKIWPQSSKYPVRNPQCPPSPKFRPDLNHVESLSNFQDIFLIIYWHDIWYKRWPHPPSLQSGTINILQVPPSSSSAKSCRILIKNSQYLPYQLSI